MEKVIISDEEVEKRLNSPMNLMNRLKSSVKFGSRNNAMDLFTKRHQISEPQVSIPTESITIVDHSAALETTIESSTTTLDKIIQNSESQIKLGLAYENSIDILNRSIAMMATKLDDVSANRLPSVIKTASDVVNSIRQERNDSRKGEKDREVHYHFYTPQQKKVEDYTVIEVA